jgi:predicted nucleic acid-binding protein
MQTLVLIDSNIFISHLRANRDPIREIGKIMDLENIVSCGVVRAEVLRGVKSLKVCSRLEAFFAITRNVPTSDSLWDEVWMLAWRLDRCGQVMPLADVIIACSALRAGAAVLTADAHFKWVPGLHVVAAG